MTDIKEFLNQLDKIKSFRGKVEYANQNLDRIGSGTGRIVYLVDNDKVLKLAKNAKGISQNEVESDIGYDHYVENIVANIFDNADDNSWILAEKANKVNEKRIKELTEIPSLSDLRTFIVNEVDRNKGKRNLFHLKQETIDFFWENEFSSNLIDFVVNYSQQPGDMGRPSTYGEVMRNGHPTIVLTDYGLNDEVYNTHYNPQTRKQKYRLYELDGSGIQYGDYLADIGNVSQEVRHGMWALVPDSVGDGDEINEQVVNFVLDRSVYPKKASTKLPQLTDIFYDNLNNLNTILKSVQDPIHYTKNLIALQNYLILHNCYDRQPIAINNKPELTEEILKEGIKRDVADKIATKIVAKRGYNQIEYLGSGMFGCAYDIGNDMVLKITSDHTEANDSFYLKNKSLNYIAEPYEVSKINLDDNSEIYLIVLEKLRTNPNLYKKHIDLLDEFFSEDIGRGYYDVIADYMHYGWEDSIQTIEYDRFMKNNPETAKFFYDILNIADEIKKHNIGSMDFVSHTNLGYKKDGTLAFFDVGFGDYFQKISGNIQSIKVDEMFGGGSKFTTSDSVSDDGFPTYNNIDTSPSISNDLSANSTLYNEDLTYKYADNATEDSYSVGIKNKNIEDNQLVMNKNNQLENTYSNKINRDKEQPRNITSKKIKGIAEELNPEILNVAKKNIPIEYTAITIDQTRGDRLLEMFRRHIPDDWSIVDRLCVIIKMGELSNIDPMKKYLSLPIQIMVTHISISDIAITLRVNIPNEIQLKNEIPHIVLAYNEKKGGRPKNSNEIVDWSELKRPIRVRGIFEEVQYKFNI